VIKVKMVLEVFLVKEGHLVHQVLLDLEVWMELLD